MYFSKEYKDNIESITHTYVGPIMTMSGTTVVKVTSKQWWKPSRKWKFPWRITDISGDIYTSLPPTEEINKLLKALQD